MTTNDQASFLNEQDRLRIWRAFGTMPGMGGLFGPLTGPRDLTVDELVKALEELNTRLIDNAARARASYARLNEYDDLFGALGALANLIGNAQKEAWKR